MKFIRILIAVSMLFNRGISYCMLKETDKIISSCRQQVVRLGENMSLFNKSFYELSSPDYVQDTRNMSIWFAENITITASLIPGFWGDRLSTAGKSYVESKWQEKLDLASSMNKRLFNGRTVSLDKMHLKNADGILRCHLDCVFSDYKHYIATRDVNYLPFISELVAHDDLIGVSSVITTADGYILIGQRGRNCDINPHMWYTVGGGIDPEDADGENINLTKTLERELKEELDGISWNLFDQRCIGISYDRQFPHPEFHFASKTELTSVKILELYQNGLLLSDEFENLSFIEATPDVLRNALFDRDRYPLCGPGLAAMLLFGGMMFGSTWLEENASCILGNAFLI